MYTFNTCSEFPFGMEGDLLEYYKFLVGSSDLTWPASSHDAEELTPSAETSESGRTANEFVFDLNEPPLEEVSCHEAVGEGLLEDQFLWPPSDEEQGRGTTKRHCKELSNVDRANVADRL